MLQFFHFVFLINANERRAVALMIERSQYQIFIDAYIAVFCVFLAASTVLLSFDGHDFTTNFTATLATLNNMGPGFNLVGPTCNYSFFSPFSKIVLIIDMLAGRLELFPILLLMTPGSWKRRL